MQTFPAPKGLLLPSPKTLNEPFGDMRQFFLLLRAKASTSDIKNIEFLPKKLDDDINNTEEVAELVIDSLEKEAARLGAKAVKEMKSSIKKPIVESLTSKDELAFSKAIILIYTSETFLYKPVNKILRNQDWDNMNNFLPYIVCFLNSIYSLDQEEKDDKVPWTKLFRGTTLSESMISEYKEGKTFSWDTITSATTSEDTALFFQAAEDDSFPVLFTIYHWNWMHPPENNNSQQYLDEKGSWKDNVDNVANVCNSGNEYEDNGFMVELFNKVNAFNPQSTDLLKDKKDHKSTPDEQAPNPDQVYTISDHSADEENKNIYEENKNADIKDILENKCDQEEIFFYVPYDSDMEHNFLNQTDTEQDSFEQAVSLSSEEKKSSNSETESEQEEDFESNPSDGSPERNSLSQTYTEQDSSEQAVSLSSEEKKSSNSETESEQEEDFVHYPSDNPKEQNPGNQIDTKQDSVEQVFSVSNEERNNLETKCAQKEDFVHDPYDNRTDYGSEDQFDTKADYAGQVFPISKYSASPHENEVIFAPGTVFKVMKVYQKDYMHCIDLKISQRYTTIKNGYQQGRFWSLIELEMVKHAIKMKKNAINLQHLTSFDMEKLVELMLQGKDFIESICLEVSSISDRDMERFLKGLCDMPKIKALRLECKAPLCSFSDTSRALSKYLAETPIREIYINFRQESEASAFIKQIDDGDSNPFKNLNTLMLYINGEQIVEDEAWGEEGIDQVLLQISVFSKVAESSITELQIELNCSMPLELEAEALNHLSKARNLEKLDLRGFTVTQNNTKDFIKCLKQIKLTHLSISISDRIGEPNLQSLLDIILADSSSMQTLCIGFTGKKKVKIDDALGTQIAIGVSQANLQVLSLIGIKITLKNLEKFVENLCQTNLTSLFLHLQLVNGKGKKSTNYIPELEDGNDLPKKYQQALLTSLHEIFPKSKLTRFGLHRLWNPLLTKELKKEFQLILQEHGIVEIDGSELEFIKMPEFPDKINYVL